MDRWFAFCGYTPHDGQVAFHSDPHRYRVMRKGRRGGGSTAVSKEVEVECQLWAGDVGQADIGIIAPTTKKTEIVFSMVHDSIVRQKRIDPKLVGTVRNAPQDRRIEFAWGARIFAWSLQEGLPGEGFGLRLLVVDEAQELPWSLWNESLRPTIIDTGGRVAFVGKAKGSGFRKLNRMEDAYPARWATHVFPTWANPAVPKEEIDEARAQMPRWQFAQEVASQFQDLGDLVFSTDDVAACVDRDWTAGDHDASGWYIDGWDLARKVDECAGYTVRGDVEPARVVEWFAEYREPWPLTQKRIAERHARWDSDIWIDSTGVGDAVLGNLDVPQDRICRDGKGYIFTQRSKTELVTNLQKMVEHHAIRIPPDPVLIQQLEDYQWDDKALETDRVMGLALACAGVEDRRKSGVGAMLL